MVFLWISLSCPNTYSMRMVTTLLSFWKGNTWTRWWTISCPCVFPTFVMLTVLFMHHPINRGYIDNIFLFKSKNRYNYTQDNCFLRQLSNQKVFLFKMSIDGVANSVDLVRQMQLSGDLENAWIMFDHFKCIEGWSTMYSVS